MTHHNRPPELARDALLFAQRAASRLDDFDPERLDSVADTMAAVTAAALTSLAMAHAALFYPYDDSAAELEDEEDEPGEGQARALLGGVSGFAALWARVPASQRQELLAAWVADGSRAAPAATLEAIWAEMDGAAKTQEAAR